MTSSKFPDTQTLRAALALAVRAPSVHNTQPWRWGVGSARLHLYAEPTLQLPNTDPDRRDLMLSCGASLHHYATALAALGWQARIYRFPDPADPNHLAALELHPHQPTDTDVALAAAIPRRRTDRRHYSSVTVSPADIALMGARAARAGVMMRRVDSLITLNSVVRQAVWLHATDADYLRELTEWSGRYGSLAGVPARNTPPSDPTAPVPGRQFAGAALAQPAGATGADDHAVIVALGTRDDDALARLRAGEAASAVLLTATMLGLASCPITEPLEVAETRAALRSEIFESGAFPQMLLRIGWASDNGSALPLTPRRPLE